MQPSPAAMRHVRALARVALDLGNRGTGSGSRVPEQLPTGAGIAPEDMLLGVTRHRLVSLLAPFAETLGVPSEVAGALHDLDAGQRRTLLAQQLELADVHGLVSGAGVPCMVIKGLPLAVQTTGDPGARGPGDIDLLVPPSSVTEVHRALASAGWRLRDDGNVTPGTWAWRHVLRNTCALTYDGPGSNIDLHWRLDTTVDALPGFDTLWARRSTAAIGGRDIDTLSARDALAQSCFHAAKDRWRWLRSLVDLHRLAGLPEVWDAADPTSLRRLEADTLAVTRAALGLPATVPMSALARIGRSNTRTVDRALHDQLIPAEKGRLTPGVESVLNFRYLVHASSTPRDLGRSVVATSLPVKVVAGIESRTGWTGVPVALWRRVRRLRQRTTAWARHEQPHGTGHEIARVP